MRLIQVYPLSNLLILHVVRGLNGLFIRALDLGLFWGVKVGSSSQELSHL